MRIAGLLVVAAVAVSTPTYADQPDGRWRLTFDVLGLGVLETVVEFAGEECVSGESISTAPARHPENLSRYDRGPLVTVRACGTTSDEATGELTTVFGDADLSFTVGDHTLTGTFAGEISGTVVGAPFEGSLPLRDYVAVLGDIEQQTNVWLYDPRLKHTERWGAFQDRLVRASRIAQDDFDIVAGFQRAWRDGLFSHYELLRPLRSLDQMVERADEAAEDKPVVHIAFTEDNIAVITIDSFFGARIADQIDGAFKATIEADARR